MAPILGQDIPVRGPARLLFRSYARSGVRRGELVRLSTTKFGDRFEVDLGSILEWQLWAFGAYEEHFAELFARLVRPGDRCVDVGANIGIHTVRLARLVGADGHVIAVEADPDLAARARHNASLNGLGNTTVITAAACEHGGGTMTLYRPASHDANRGRASLLPHGYLTGEAVDVATVRLDEVVEGPVRLIKIDVEGYEASVLAGATRILREHTPMVVLEYCPELLRGAGNPLERLTGLGYDLYGIRPVRHRLTGHVRLSLERLSGRPDAAMTNLLAVPPADRPPRAAGTPDGG